MSRIEMMQWLKKVGFDPDLPDYELRTPSPKTDERRDNKRELLWEQILYGLRRFPIGDLIVALGIWYGADYLYSRDVADGHLMETLVVLLSVIAYFLTRLSIWNLKRAKALDAQVYSLKWKRDTVKFGG